MFCLMIYFVTCFIYFKNIFFFNCRFRDDVEIVKDDRHEITEVDATFSLKIFDVTLEDDAEYTVTATNTVGSVSSIAEIFVNPAGRNVIVLFMCR